MGRRKADGTARSRLEFRRIRSAPRLGVIMLVEPFLNVLNQLCTL